jgi:two-component system chemotaxis response regulator CheY
MSGFPETIRILCVDDMATMRRLVDQSLRSQGYSDVTFGADGQEGWDALVSAYDSRTPFDLLLSDWMMPRLTGIELLRKVRADERFKNLPVLMLTSESETSHMIEAIRAGVSHYVTKPFTPEVLKAKMDQVFANLNRG